MLEGLSQLSQLLKHNSTMLASLFENNKILQHLHQSIQSPQSDSAANSSAAVTQVLQQKSKLVETIEKSIEK